MIRFLSNIAKADQDAKLSSGNDFFEHMKILEIYRTLSQIHENDIDTIIKINQELELQHAEAKKCGDLDSSVNGDFMLD